MLRRPPEVEESFRDFEGDFEGDIRIEFDLFRTTFSVTSSSSLELGKLERTFNRR
jgi:hypothetical protein